MDLLYCEWLAVELRCSSPGLQSALEPGHTNTITYDEPRGLTLKTRWFHFVNCLFKVTGGAAANASSRQARSGYTLFACPFQSQTLYGQLRESHLTSLNTWMPGNWRLGFNSGSHPTFLSAHRNWTELAHICIDFWLIHDASLHQYTQNTRSGWT